MKIYFVQLILLMVLFSCTHAPKNPTTVKVTPVHHPTLADIRR